MKFLRDCLRKEPPVAPISMISDSQMNVFIDVLLKQPNGFSLLDYGCGNLRLLNAMQKRLSDKPWRYCGIDTELLDTPHPLKQTNDNQQYDFMLADELRSKNDMFDCAVLMNVIHELSLLDIATTIEDIRQHLKQDGKLFIIDLYFMPEGEPNFVPFYQWEICGLAKQGIVDRCFKSRIGIPIIFYEISASNIIHYHHLVPILESIFRNKRNYLTKMSVKMSSMSDEDISTVIGSDVGKEYSYAYINTILANTSHRLDELNYIGPVTNLNTAAYEIYKFTEDTNNLTRQAPTPVQIYEQFRNKFGYLSIYLALYEFEKRRAIFSITDPEIPIVPSEIWDEINPDEIVLRGISPALLMAKINKDRNFGYF